MDGMNDFNPFALSSVKGEREFVSILLGVS